MLSAQELLSKIRAYHPNPDEPLILKAYIFSKNSHGSQKRHSGDPYFSHPVAVAEILTDLKLDQSSIITALLHDVVEDTDVTLEEIEKEFGVEVARLVDGVTKLGKISSVPANEHVAENFRKLTLAMSGDIRVLLVKLADRLHNMRTLHYVPSKEKRIKKAQESLDIYASLAGRIGLSKIKDEMQDLAFAVIDSEARSQIIARLDEMQEKNKNLIEKILADLNRLFAEEGMKCEVSGRQKKPFSIWSKMKSFNISFHDINDIMAFRVVTENIAECYRALGVINSSYSMIPGSFKDYISTPKENGYQSLHLTILGPFNKKIEVQIRDQKMHELSDLGVAAHWRYKENFSGKKVKSGQMQVSEKATQEQSQYRWIRELISLFETSENAGEVLNQYKTSLRQDEVFCFTPNGDIFNLPLGSTAVDFAYAVHSEVGNNCAAAKINGAIVPLRQKIENGDQVEIITAKTAKPSLNWLQFAVTTKAKSSIRAFVRSEKFEEYSKLGKAILQKFFAARSLEINDKVLGKTLTKLHAKTVDDLCVKIAEGKLQRHDVLKIAYPDFVEEEKAKSVKIGDTIKKKKKQPFIANRRLGFWHGDALCWLLQPNSRRSNCWCDQYWQRCNNSYANLP
jgi:guanosine-3',5'-bis(diphosphate) 3'-pyrophosphohydrolase